MLLEAADPPAPSIRPDAMPVSPLLAAKRAKGVMAVAIPVCLAVLFGAAAIQGWRKAERNDTDQLLACLDLLRDQRRVVSSRSTELRYEYTEIQIYVAGKFGPRLRESGLSGIPSTLVPAAQEALKLSPYLSRSDFEHARRLVEPAFDDYLARRRAIVREADRIGLPATLGLLSMIALGIAGLGSVILAIAKPGGIVNDMIGIQVVDADGNPLTRGRSALRGLVTWSPLAVAIFAPAAWADAPSAMSTLLFWTPAIVLTLGAWLAMNSPSRGVADALCGTWVI